MTLPPLHRARRRLAGRVLLAVALLAPAASCARHHEDDEIQEPVEPVVVVFANQSLAQADVYAIIGNGSTVRMGTVMAGMTSSLRVPPAASNAGRINIVARLLAVRNSPRTGLIAISPGDRVGITLPIDGKTLNVMMNP